jgi:hypothetical protein
MTLCGEALFPEHSAALLDAVFHEALARRRVAAEQAPPLAGLTGARPVGAAW